MVERTPATLYGQRPAPAPAPQSNLPFGTDFQGMLLKLLVENTAFSRSLVGYLKPNYFQNEAMAWAWGWALHYRESYAALPSFALIMDQTRFLDANLQPVYQAVLDMVRQRPVSDELYLRDQTMDFVRRQIFRQSFLDSKDLFNAGHVDKAYDMVQERMDELRAVQWETADRQWLGEGFAERHIERQRTMAEGTFYTGTAIPMIDNTLGGGAYPGFAGLWLARPKAGKTTFLTNLGAVAMRAYQRNVLHVPLEGSGKYIADRYDTIFTEELYANVRSGDIDAARYALAFQEMQMMRRKCVIRAFTDEWDYDITHVWNEMRELKQMYGWEPDVIILDYVDLLNGRPKPGGYKSDTSSAKAASQDVKSLANRGYAVWTASQVQRPKDKDFDETQEVLKSREIADCYARVRIFDLIGSLNQTREERQQGVLRLYLELYRDGESDQEILVSADFQRMKIGGAPVAPATLNPSATHVQKQLGYVQSRGV